MTFAKSPWASEGSTHSVFPRREPVGTLSLGGDRSAALGGSNASVYPRRGPLSNQGRPLAGLRRLIAGSALAIGLSVATLSPGLALAQDDPRVFSDTGYTITDDAIWGFFSQYGGASTFGEPISREFTLKGKPVQLFQNAALQVEPDGSVRAVQLTDPGLVSATQLDGLTVPAADPAVAFVTPTPDQPNYSARLQVFVQNIVPDSRSGQPVQFLSTFTTDGGTAVLGLPTSSPKADPANPSFVYQRFQNGILFYDAAAGTTGPLPLGEHLKGLITSGKLSADVSEAFVPDA